MSPIVRLALFACPPAFRREYADEMLRDLDARNATIFSACSDVVRTGLALRFESIARDIVLAFRGLAKARLYAFVTIATIAIAISVNVAVASVVEGVLLQPLPYPNSSRIVYIEEALNNRDFSYLNALDLKKSNRTLESLGISWSVRSTLTGVSVPVTLQGLIVNPDYFHVLGARAQLGRLFTWSDLGEQRIILSDRIWKKWFHSDPDVVGKAIDVDASKIRIIGVAPSGFRDISPIGLDEHDFWVCADPRSALGRTRGWANFTAWGLMRSGVTVQAANADVNRVMQRVGKAHPMNFGGYSRSLVQPASSVIAGPVTTMLWLLYGAVFMLLIIACANVANLSLVRAASREREFVVRAALGASRRRIAGQLCVESAIIALIAGAIGVLLAAQELRAFSAFGSVILPRWENVHIDAAVLVYTAGLLVLVAIVAGLLPAFFNRRDLCAALKDAGRSGDNSAGARVRSSLIVAEIALALAVVASAGLIVRSYAALTNVNVGFDAANAYIMRVPGLPAARYSDKTARMHVVDHIVRGIRTIPGVTDVAVSAVVPFKGEFNVGTSIPSVPSFHDNIDGNSIAPGFFKALHIPLLRGREFNDRDRADSQPVAIVSASFARRFFGSPGGAMGAKITPGLSDTDNVPPRVIVGVVSDTRNSLSAPPDEELYVPQTQFEAQNIIFVRTDRRSEGLTAAISRVFTGIDPLFPAPIVTSYAQIIAGDAERSAAAAALFALLAAVAVILALAGVYSVTAFSMAQRTRELGIRKAIGARDADIIAGVLWTTLRQTLIGVVIGVALAASAAKLLSAILFQTSALDPATFTSVCALLLICCAAGALFPATRSLAIDPSRALRYE